MFTAEEYWRKPEYKKIKIKHKDNEIELKKELLELFIKGDYNITYLLSFNDLIEFIKENIKFLIIKFYKDVENNPEENNPEENIIKKIKDYNGTNIINITPETIFYSSIQSIYGEADTFENKDFCWMSDLFNQSLLHIFNKSRLGIVNPDDLITFNIYRFKLKDKDRYRIINSIYLTNIDIFKGLIDDNLIEILKMFFFKIQLKLNIKKCKGNIHLEDKVCNSSKFDIFKEENNINILFIIKALNDFLPEELKIYGYYNYFDQRETALVDFNKIIDKSTIKKSTITKYIKILKDKKEIITFPIEEKNIKNCIEVRYTKPLESEPLSLYKNYARMALFENRIIEYTDFDDDTIRLEYKNENPEEYFKNKYLKYKLKYYNLRNNKI